MSASVFLSLSKIDAARVLPSKESPLKKFHALSVELSIANRSRSLSDLEIFQYTTQFQALFEHSSSKGLIKIASVLIDHNIYCSGNLFLQILQKLRDENPEPLRPYFDIQSKKAIMLSAGLHSVIEIYSGSYRWEESIEFVDIDSLAEKFTHVLLGDTPLNMGWIYTDPYTLHMTPVYIRRERAGNLKLLVTDSKGKGGTRALLDKLEALVPEDSKVCIYANSSLRQRDGYACSAFSLLDLRNIFEREQNRGNIFVYIEQQKLQPYRKHVMWFEILPFEMMKTTQSIRQLERYKQTSPIPEYTPVIRRQSQEGLAFEFHQDKTAVSQSLESNIRFGPDSYKLNKYIERKWMKMVFLILVKAYGLI